MNENVRHSDGSPTVETGETVYNEAGEVVGVVREVGDGEFTTRTLPETSIEESYDSDEDIPDAGIGEGFLMWRCGECGKMGERHDGVPERCPSCDAPKEAIARTRED